MLSCQLQTGINTPIMILNMAKKITIPSYCARERCLIIIIYIFLLFFQLFQSTLLKVQDDVGLMKGVEADKLFGNIKVLLLCNMSFYLNIHKVLIDSQGKQGTPLNSSLLKDAFQNVSYIKNNVCTCITTYSKHPLLQNQYSNWKMQLKRW